jgi:transglutaminase-like putative cysteine protease
VNSRGPDTLLPLGTARLLGFAALGSLGALEWQRLIDGMGSGRALLWVAAATAAGAAVLACDRLSPRMRAAGTIAAACGGLLAAFVVSGIDLDYLRPRLWGDLADGLVSGTQALGTVRLPYSGADPWPRAALELLGSGLLAVAALLTCWPRGGGARGYPYLALILLMVLVASPVVSLGGTRSLVLGVALAALTVCFLWLERLPLRPGIGVAALLGVALAGALPVAAVVDRGEPWFDYKAFAENLGPDDPVRFSWAQDYGPIDWPRDGNEVMRVTSDEPYYWKAANLEEFDGRTWLDAGAGGFAADPESELRDDWRDRPGWRRSVHVSLRRIDTADVIAPGTIMGIRDATSSVRPSGEPGRWQSDIELRRGDSDTADVYVPAPSAAELREADVARLDNERRQDLDVTVPFRAGFHPTAHQLGAPGNRVMEESVIYFRPFGEPGGPFAEFPSIRRTLHDGAAVLQRSRYRRTWALAQRLLADAETPFEYVLAVNGYLHDGFTYSERPSPPDRGVPPLDAFINDTKDGYCQHFAGAMALLLRMGGIPARVATGFSPGGFSRRRNAWIVRDTDAHAWVEAWFEPVGWVTLDPTPDATPARSQVAALETPAPTADASPSPTAQPDEGPGGADDGPGGLRQDLLRNDPAFDETAAAGGGPPWWVWGGGGLALVLVTGWVVLVLRGPRALRALSPEDRAIAELEAALRRSGRPAPMGTTLRQLEKRLGGEPDVTAYLRALSDGRYGGTPVAPTVAQRRALRRALAQGLGPTGRLRALWALPPRAR